MVSMERVCDRPNILEGGWRNKVIVKGQGKNPKIVSLAEEF